MIIKDNCLSLISAESCADQRRRDKWTVLSIDKVGDLWIVKSELRTKPIKYKMIKR